MSIFSGFGMQPYPQAKEMVPEIVIFFLTLPRRLRE